MAIFSHFQWGISGCTSKPDGFWVDEIVREFHQDDSKLFVYTMKVSSLTFSFLRASTHASRICGGRFELMVITKALTLRGLAHSFLLRASAVTLAFPGSYRILPSKSLSNLNNLHGRVSSSSSNKLSVVGSRKLSPSLSASL
ncbi:hypothetical protein Tco_0905020 [Tanacetum coccineum]